MKKILLKIVFKIVRQIWTKRILIKYYETKEDEIKFVSQKRFHLSINVIFFVLQFTREEYINYNNRKF